MKPDMLFVQILFVAAQLMEPGKAFPLCIQNHIHKARFQLLIHHISKADFEHQESDSWGDSWRLAKFVWQMTLIVDKDSHSAACDRKPPWSTAEQTGRE